VDWCRIPIVRVQTERGLGPGKFQTLQWVGLSSVYGLYSPRSAHAVPGVLTWSPACNNDVSIQSAGS